VKKAAVALAVIFGVGLMGSVSDRSTKIGFAQEEPEPKPKPKPPPKPEPKPEKPDSE
jgi:hypothetical protein